VTHGVRDLWQHGIELEVASIRFAPRSFRRELQNAPKIGGALRGFLKAIADYGTLDDIARQKLNDSANDANAAWAELKADAEFRKKCQDYLLKQLSRDKLVAYGYSKGAKTPALIPAFLFEYSKHVIWEKSSVIGNDLQFISVRIACPPLQRSKALGLPIPIPAKNHPKLRSAKLIAIIKQLDKDLSFRNSLRKTQANLVRSEAIKKHIKTFPGGRGADVKTISAYLRRHYLAD
jgi:hypothetical protein